MSALHFRKLPNVNITFFSDTTEDLYNFSIDKNLFFWIKECNRLHFKVRSKKNLSLWKFCPFWVKDVRKHVVLGLDMPGHSWVGTHNFFGQTRQNIFQKKLTSSHSYKIEKCNLIRVFWNSLSQHYQLKPLCGRFNCNLCLNCQKWRLIFHFISFWHY